MYASSRKSKTSHKGHGEKAYGRVLDLRVSRFAKVLSNDLGPSFVCLLKQEKDSVDPLVDSTDLIQQLVEDGIG